MHYRDANIMGLDSLLCAIVCVGWLGSLALECGIMDPSAGLSLCLAVGSQLAVVQH